MTEPLATGPADAGGARREVKARGTSWARRVAAALAKAGVRPNFISFLSVVFAAAGGALMVLAALMECTFWRIGLYFASAVSMQLRLLCNLFDGMVAVEGGLRTASGEVFNDLPDRLSDSLLLVGAGYAVADIPFGVPLGWVAALLAVMTAYVRVLGASAGAGHHFLGPMAKQHRMAVLTIAVLAAACAAPWHADTWILFGALAVVAAGSAATVVRRTIVVVSTLEKR